MKDRMTVKTHLVVADIHAHPDHNNDRADLLAKLCIDVRPDVVINLGDSADMASLSSYDRGTREFQFRNYEKDINAHLDFQDRWWSQVRRTKRKLPYRVVLEGNHDERIKRAINVQPELEGAKYGISPNDLSYSEYYNVVVPYYGGTPGIFNIDGIAYAHYFVSGVKGMAIGGEHPAYQLLNKNFVSCTVGHSHTIDFSSRTTATGQRINGLVAGCFFDYFQSWAGEATKKWWSGVVLKKNVDGEGNYDPMFISMDQLRKEYG